LALRASIASESSAASVLLDAKRYVAKSLENTFWIDPEVTIECEPIAAAFWDLLGVLTLPDALLDGAFVAADATRVVGLHLGETAPSYAALGRTGDFDLIPGGWHSDQNCPIPIELLFSDVVARFPEDAFVEASVSWESRQSPELKRLRLSASRLAKYRVERPCRRAIETGLEMCSIVPFRLRSILLDRALWFAERDATVDEAPSREAATLDILGVSVGCKTLEPSSRLALMLSYFQLVLVAFPLAASKLLDITVARRVLVALLDTFHERRNGGIPIATTRNLILVSARTILLVDRVTSGKDISLDASFHPKHCQLIAAAIGDSEKGDFVSALINAQFP